MIKLKKNKFKDLIIVEGVQFHDQRGYLREVLIEKKIKKKFKFQIVSKSKKNVLRGLHYQKNKPQGKFISVIKGKIYDVAVDLRKNSKTYGKHFSLILSDKNCKSLYIPAGFAHGFQTLEAENVVLYSCTEYRSKNNEYCINYKDKDLNIKWPLKNSLITDKDKKAKFLKDL